MLKVLWNDNKLYASVCSRVLIKTCNNINDCNDILKRTTAEFLASSYVRSGGNVLSEHGGTVLIFMSCK